MRHSRGIADTELEVLKALWSHGPATVRQLLDVLKEQGRSWAYTTLQTLLGRLHDKGYVSVRKRGRAHVYRAELSRQDLLSEHLDALADKVCGGAATPLLMSLFQGRDFAPEEIARFREMLDELEGQAGGRSPRRRKR